MQDDREKGNHPKNDDSMATTDTVGSETIGRNAQIWQRPELLA